MGVRLLGLDGRRHTIKAQGVYAAFQEAARRDGDEPYTFDEGMDLLREYVADGAIRRLQTGGWLCQDREILEFAEELPKVGLTR